MHNEDVRAYREALDTFPELTEKQKMDLIDEYRDALEQQEYDDLFAEIVANF